MSVTVTSLSLFTPVSLTNVIIVNDTDGSDASAKMTSASPLSLVCVANVTVNNNLSHVAPVCH